MHVHRYTRLRTGIGGGLLTIFIVISVSRHNVDLSQLPACSNAMPHALSCLLIPLSFILDFGITGNQVTRRKIVEVHMRWLDRVAE